MFRKPKIKLIRWSLDKLTPPWGNAPSIYTYIRDNPNAHNLPDETPEPNKIRFAAGAWDGVVSHHMGSSSADKASARAEKLEQALETLLRFSTDQNLNTLYQEVVAESIYPIADEIVKRVATRVPRVQPEIAAIGRYFVTGADQREATKFGIILLSVAGEKADFPLLETLAGHDEFALFAAVALTRLVDDPEQCIWRLAQRVHGWGRIHLVERLDGTSNHEIQDWMLREGFRNSVLDNYLAEICARNGKLHEVLQQREIDMPLLDSAADLLNGILEGGPSAGIDDYDHAPEALQGYLTHLRQNSGLKLSHYMTVDQINRFLTSDDSWENRFTKGWTSQLYTDLRARCETVLGWDDWGTKAEQALNSDNEVLFYMADTVASRLGLNTWEIHFKRVQKAPLGRSWYRLMQLSDESNIDGVLEFALTVLSVDKIATGPRDDLGLGPGFELHQVLDTILQELSRFPERGWQLIEIALQSPVVRNRNLALKALLSWPRERWPADAFPLLKYAARLEPNADLKQRLTQAIQVN